MARRSYFVDPAVFFRLVICLAIMVLGYLYHHGHF